MTAAALHSLRAAIHREVDGLVHDIATTVARETAIPLDRLVGRTRTARIVRARHLAMRVARERGASVLEIGAYFGRDHSSVIHATRGNA